MTLYCQKTSLCLREQVWRRMAGSEVNMLAGQAMVTPGIKSAVFRREGTV